MVAIQAHAVDALALHALPVPLLSMLVGDDVAVDCAVDVVAWTLDRALNLHLEYYVRPYLLLADLLPTRQQYLSGSLMYAMAPRMVDGFEKYDGQSCMQRG